MAGRQTKNRFIEKSLLGIISFIKNSIYAEDIASKNGLLQHIDVRVKMPAIIAFIFCIMFTRSIPLLGCLYVFAVLLAVLSNIELVSFLKRTWVFMPLFSLFIAFPALFSFFSPGAPLYIAPFF